MSFWDDFENIALNVVTGGAAGALGAALGSDAPATGGGFGFGNQGTLQGIGAAVNAVAQQQAAAAAAAAAKSATPCCNRFQLHGGFLIDGVTGHVWKFNDQTNVLEEIPVSNSPPKRSLIDILASRKVTAIASAYRAEVLATLPEAEREKQFAVFEKTYLEPLRAATATLSS